MVVTQQWALKRKLQTIRGTCTIAAQEEASQKTGSGAPAELQLTHSELSIIDGAAARLCGYVKVSGGDGAGQQAVGAPRQKENARGGGDPPAPLAHSHDALQRPREGGRHQQRCHIPAFQSGNQGERDLGGGVR